MPSGFQSHVAGVVQLSRRRNNGVPKSSGSRPSVNSLALHPSSTRGGRHLARSRPGPGHLPAQRRSLPSMVRRPCRASGPATVVVSRTFRCLGSFRSGPLPAPVCRLVHSPALDASRMAATFWPVTLCPPTRRSAWQGLLERALVPLARAASSSPPISWTPSNSGASAGSNRLDGHEDDQGCRPHRARPAGCAGCSRRGRLDQSGPCSAFRPLGHQPPSGMPLAMAESGA